MRLLSCLVAGLLVVGQTKAHDVIWWEDPDGLTPGNVMDFYYPAEVLDYVSVVPSWFEPCTVQVNLDAPSSTLVSAQVLPPNPGNVVDILVTILRPPTGSVETATITGEWHATGFPTNHGCTAVTPNPFAVPISVLNRPLLWKIALAPDARSVSLDAGVDCALQAADSLAGPWLNVGEGQTFTANSDMPAGFFHRLRQLGGGVSGMVTDSAGSPLSGLTLGLLYGGPTATTDANGTFTLPRLPWGLSLITISNVIGASLNIVIPTTNDVTPAFKVAMTAGSGPGTNGCNCTPWCAIGFGSLPGEQTPVYYAGGANPPTVGPANCGQPQVTITSPTGTTFPIVPGSSRHQNSGPNPASGAWTVTTTVCGQTKSCTVTVP